MRLRSSGAEAARASWEKGKARFLTHGRLRPWRPMLHKVSGFYIASIGRLWSEAHIDYLEQYNARLKVLTQELGLPSWAPASRLPPRPHLLGLMSDARPVRSLEELEALGLRALGYAVRSSDLVPTLVYRRLEDSGLLLLGSDISTRTGCIDVLDLRERLWMVSEEFDREEVGSMPWDSLPRAIKAAVPTFHESARAARAAAHEARRRAEQEARERGVLDNRRRCAELSEKLKERDLTCPHCQVLSRGFRFLPGSERFVCLSCGRSSLALAFSRDD